MKNDTKLFESKKVRTHWNEKEKKWYFSLIDAFYAVNQKVKLTAISNRFCKD